MPDISSFIMREQQEAILKINQEESENIVDKSETFNVKVEPKGKDEKLNKNKKR